MYTAHHAAEHPDQPALVMASSGEVVRFREYEAACNRVAHLFRDQGLRRLIRGTGAKWLGTRQFWQKSKFKPAPEENVQPEADRDFITEEFKERWL